MPYYIICLFFYCILCGGGLFAAVCRGHSFGKASLLHAMTLILAAYVFAALGLLPAGAAVLTLLSVILLVFALIEMTRNHFEKAKILLTPAFCVFSVFFVIICICNRGRMIWYADDFRHWATVVKVMVQENILGCDAAARLMHSNYPPAMALFQYFPQYLHKLLFPAAGFSDALLYVANESAVILLFLPFLPEKFGNRRVFLQLIVYLLAIMCIALVFSPLVLHVVMIDGFLGLLFGCGAALLVTGDFEKRPDRYAFVLLLGVLTLTKNIGAMLACILLCASLGISDRTGKEAWKRFIGNTAGIALPYFSWKWLLHLGGGVQKFTNPVPAAEVFRVIRGNCTEFERAVIQQYYSILLKEPVQTGELGIPMHFSLLMLLFAAAFFLLYRVRKVHMQQDVRKLLAVPAVLWIATLLYALAMPLVYLFQFSAEEARTAIMWDRYLLIPLSGMLFLLAVMIDCEKLPPIKRKNTVGIVFLSVLMLMMPWKEPARLLTGHAARQSRQQYAGYAAAIDNVQRAVEDPKTGNILVVMQTAGPTGVEGEAVRYYLRPMEAKVLALKEEDSCRMRIQAAEGVSESEAFRRYLLQEAYDYVLLYTVDAYFCETYADAFSDAKAIRADAVFCVDQTTGALQPCMD